MKIAIVGRGNVGSALAEAMTRAGHEVTFAVRNPNPQALDEVSIAQGANWGDVIILAVPFLAALELVSAESFVGKLLIDATNPLAMGPDGLGLTMGYSTSGAETLAAAAPQAKLVKAFNQTGFENMRDAGRLEARPLMLIAGDHADANAIASRLALDAGFEAVELGNLRQARLLEPLAMIWIELARKQGAGAGFAFAFTREKIK